MDAIARQVVSDAEYCFHLRPFGAQYDSSWAASPQGWHSGRVHFSIESLESRRRRESSVELWPAGETGSAATWRNSAAVTGLRVLLASMQVRESAAREQPGRITMNAVQSRGADRSTRLSSNPEPAPKQSVDSSHSPVVPSLNSTPLLQSTEKRRRRMNGVSGANGRAWRSGGEPRCRKRLKDNSNWHGLAKHDASFAA
jgi:hypothetical protein